MRNYISILLLLIGFSINAQNITPVPNQPVRTIEKKYVDFPMDHFQKRSYGETWFTTVVDLVNIGEIAPLSNEPWGQQALLAGLFPDSSIIDGVDVVTKEPYYPFIHGMAEIVNPSLTPSGWTDQYAKIVVDSVEIPFVYTRNTTDDIIDTLFVDYLRNHADSFMSYYDLNQNGKGDFGEFPHQTLLHTDASSNKLDAIQIFRTDTILLTTEDSTTEASAQVTYRGLDVSDTILGSQRYGIYLRYQPGYEWTLEDTLDDFNAFYLLTREQEVGEMPRQIWPFKSGFCSYALTSDIRYNMHQNAYALIPGIIPVAEWQLEHLIISYKFTTNALSTPEIENQIGLKVFPNPAEEIVNIGVDLKSEKEINVHIYDFLGKEVYSHGFGHFPKGKNIFSVDLTSLKAGVYSVNVNGVNRKIVLK